MGKSVLQRLHNGEIDPAEQVIPRCPEYRATNREISDDKQYFYGVLSENDRKRFDEMFNRRYAVSSMEQYAHFAYGFRLGALLMGEVMGETE